MAGKPQMVSLDDFGKPPPPPPKNPPNWPQIIGGGAFLLFIVVGFFLAIPWMEKVGMGYWSSSSELADAGRFASK